MEKLQIDLVNDVMRRFSSVAVFRRKLRLANKKLTPRQRLQFTPIAFVGKFRTARKEPCPGESSKHVPSREMRRLLWPFGKNPLPFPNVLLRLQRTC